MVGNDHMSRSETIYIQTWAEVFCHAQNIFCTYVLIKGAMSRIAQLLSYHSFGAKNSLERQKIPLNQACKYKVLVAFQLLLVSHLD